MEVLAPRIYACATKTFEALELERVWLRERKATAFSLRNGFNIFLFQNWIRWYTTVTEV
jgi:hypothetical protein